MDWSGALGTPVIPIRLDEKTEVWDLPKFDGYGDPRRLDVIARIAEAEGRDPRIATLAVDIFRKAGVPSRDYKGQAAALLAFVQREIYYINEPDERLQSPSATLRLRYGDCDDLLILLYALCIAVRLPFRLVISGYTKTGAAVRYIHRAKGFDRSVKFTHIYGQIGDRPYGEPVDWWFAEPTLNVPLGWDVVAAGGNILPEMKRPPTTRPTPAYGAAMNSAIPTSMNDSSQRRTARFTPGLPRPASAADYPGTSGFKPNIQGDRLAKITADKYTGLVPPPAGLSEDSPSAQLGSDPADVANSVAVLITDKAGQILLLHRSPDQQWMGGAWDLPGGAVDSTKPARDQAVSMLERETGLKVPASALFPLVTAYHPAAGTAIFYTVNLGTSSVVETNAPEHFEFRWVGPDDNDGKKDMQLVPYIPMVLEALKKFRRADYSGPRSYGAAESGMGSAQTTIWKVLGVVGAVGIVGAALGFIDVTPRRRNR